jgi:hypothetical protein
MGGSTSTPITSLAEMRTTPRTPAPWLLAARSSEAAVLSMASAWVRRACATSVGISPTCERVNSTTPSAFSSAATWRPAVGWVMPSARAAPDSEPSRSTPRNER